MIHGWRLFVEKLFSSVCIIFNLQCIFFFFLAFINEYKSKFEQLVRYTIGILLHRQLLRYFVIDLKQ